MFWIFLLLSAAAVILPLVTRPVYYMVADDYLLNYIANGSYGYETSDHLIFIKTLLGRLLKLLYGVTGAVNWYMVLLALLLSLSFAVLMQVLMMRSGRVWIALLPLIPELVVVPFFFTFTVVAFFAAAAGGALMSCVLEEERFETGHFAGALLFFAASFALRKDSFLAGTALIAPVMLDAVLTGQQHALSGGRTKIGALFGGVLRKAAVPFLGFVLTAGAVEALDRFDYRSDAWQDYQRYNTARGDVVDYVLPPYDFMKEVLDGQGLSKIDYAMLSGWKFCERSLFTTERLESLSARTHEFVTREYRLNYVKGVLTKSNLMLCVIPFLVWLLFLIRKRDRHKLSGLLVLLFNLLLLYLLTYDLMRFVHRVGMPLSVVSVLALLLCEHGEGGEREMSVTGPEGQKAHRKTSAGESEGQEAHRKTAAEGRGKPDASGERRSFAGMRIQRIRPIQAVGIAATGALILVFGTSYLKQYLNSNYYAFRTLAASDAAGIREELRSHPDTLYVIDAGLLSDIYYYDRPVQQLLYTEDFANVIRSGSWDSYSPRYYQQASRYVADADDLLTDLVNETNVRFVTTDSSGMRKFLAERCGREIDSEAEAFFEGRGVGVVRFF